MLPLWFHPCGTWNGLSILFALLLGFLLGFFPRFSGSIELILGSSSAQRNLKYHPVDRKVELEREDRIRVRVLGLSLISTLDRVRQRKRHRIPHILNV
ncbi:hypothetical protein Mapa_002161 [Marchantia paleacea]|nr:hypothetical protein Mapa_002161 [Marchantia paleacea]